MMPDDAELSLAYIRLTDLAFARGAVPGDGSGIDGVWTDEFPDVDHSREWFVAVNADGEEREYRLTEERTMDIKPYRAHAWWGTDLVVPAAILTPCGGQAGVTDEFERSTEDQLIASAEAVLDGLDYDDYEAVICDVE